MNFALNLQLCLMNNESILSAARKNNRQCLWAWAARDSTSYAGPAGDSPAASGWYEGLRSRTACAGSRLRAKVWARADPAQAVRDLAGFRANLRQLGYRRRRRPSVAVSGCPISIGGHQVIDVRGTFHCTALAEYYRNALRVFVRNYHVC